MATYSVQNIFVEDTLRFKPAGVTAGYILSINASGDSQWIVAPSGGGGGGGGSVGTQSFQKITHIPGSTATWSMTNGFNANITINSSTASLAITGATNGDYGTLIVTQGATGSYRITSWPSASVFPQGTYSFTTTGTASDIFSFVYDGSTYWWNYNKTFR